MAGPTLPVPEGFPHSQVSGPWWIIEMAAGPDNYTRAPHRHQDHVFVAVFDGQVQPPETRVRWVSDQEVADLEGIVPDSRLLAKALFPVVEELTAEAAVQGDGTARATGLQLRADRPRIGCVPAAVTADEIEAMIGLAFGPAARLGEAVEFGGGMWNTTLRIQGFSGPVNRSGRA